MPGTDLLAFSVPMGPGRKDLVLWTSRDSGASWQRGRTVTAGAGAGSADGEQRGGRLWAVW